MADARSRGLQRQAAVSGDPESSAALLRERGRTGALSAERVELAARLGHSGARLLYPKAKPVDRGKGPRDETIKAAALLLGETLPARYAIDMAERAYPAWESWDPDDLRGRKAIDAAKVWVDCPCEEHAESSTHLGKRAHRACNDTEGEYPGPTAADKAAAKAAARAVKTAAFAGYAAIRAEQGDDLDDSAQWAEFAVEHQLEASQHAARAAIALKEEERVASSKAQRAAKAKASREVNKGLNAKEKAKRKAAAKDERAAAAKQRREAAKRALAKAEKETIDWQRARLAAYLLGEVDLTPRKKKKKKKKRARR